MTDFGSGAVPGQYLLAADPIEINAGADRVDIEVVNTGDRPVQVGSHVHFPQANAALAFDRGMAHGRRLDIPAGTAVRFEPGLPQRVSLVPLGGSREVYGIGREAPGRLGPVTAAAEEQEGPVGR
ncbi:urease subunit beta [Nocardia nova SH22a]|uniref:Urease subunit beta n=1 Tax=Nocardia nova SH22a TaxID=1415166 RepID=W5TLC7_9NOCA|nr:urease subunit beta [Nocardia nova]AHH18031.1 urease subunit beta [Nocardia nova SH22a]